MNKKAILFIYLLIYFLFPFPQPYAQPIKVNESTLDHILIELNFNNSYSVRDTTINGKDFQIIISKENYYRNPGEPWIPVFTFNLGIPHSSHPEFKIISDDKTLMNNKFILPFPKDDPVYEKLDINNIDNVIYSKNKLFPVNPIMLDSPFTFRYSKILPVIVSPFQFNPVTRELVFHNKITIRIDFNAQSNNAFKVISDAMNDNALKSSVINYEVAKNFSGKSLSGDFPLGVNSGWYDPNQNYFKIYLKDKGVYRVTYNELINAGVPLGSSTPINKIELINLGESVPIDIVDGNSDQIFNAGDYFQFVGFPPPASPNAYFNIYNLSNVYWFSYESDSGGNIYKDINGYPQSWDLTVQSTLHTLHFEKDSIFDRLGYCSTDEVDYWFWGKATAQNGQAVSGFEDSFPAFVERTQDSNYVTLRVQMHGITNSPWCSTDHKAEIQITDQPIGVAIWDGQEPKLFEKKFYISADSIHIYPTGNRLNVWVRGDICTSVHSDEIRVNWYEFEYWRNLRVNSNNFIFKSSTNGNIRFWTTRWLRDNMKIYIPGKNKLISNPRVLNDQYNSVTFVDTSSVGTEYFCVADDYYLTVDSIVADQPSDLGNISNGADYIIITHPDFNSAAQNLADFRNSNFPDPEIDNVRVMVVDINQIYDEFSYGLLDPYSLQKFVKYAFENWENPAPSYVVLIGDMSYDYRRLLENGRPNFIPSIPFFANDYGQAASDNMIVAVSGTDVVPDLAIGRLSCETIDEANILVNKIINYPADNTKAWKQNTIFLASGLDEDDENRFGFNDASLALGNSYVKPFGYNPTYVFRYPTKPEHEPYEGGGARMREEINRGAALINYYGHGGGSQWDLVFTDDDIDLLENGGRLPVILSLTCYTAHFDNQRIFGEHFNLVPNRGSIGFFGSSGLTYWSIAKAINSKLYNEIFPKKNFIIGKAILNAKNQIPSTGLYGVQIALLTFLGDPAMQITLPKFPDFEVNPSDITISPENPVVEDSINVKVIVHNLGRIFPLDSVTVKVVVNATDTNYVLGSTKLPSYGEIDSVMFTWVPQRGDLFEIKVLVNEDNLVDEVDHSDNIASQYFIVFNLSEPNVLEPIDGLSTTKNSVDFVLSDIGYYINRELFYTIEIDTSYTFDNPIASSPLLSSSNPILRWTSPQLLSGIYFWRARIFDGEEYGNWNKKRSFTISDTARVGYFAHGKILKTFTTYNLDYSDSTQSLSLNTELLPARPSPKTLLGDIEIIPPLSGLQNLTAITTDGTYLYFGSISFFVNNGPSHIYRVGTGYNGTVRGQQYGEFSTFYDKIMNAIVYHSDGYIYISTGHSHQITRINVSTEVIDTVSVPPGLLRWENSTTTDGPVLLTSDGTYIYNLTLKDEQGNNKYTLRTFDPSNGWDLAKPDIQLTGSSYPNFTGFFVFDNYIYPAEYYTNYMRRIRLDDGFFEEEWLTSIPFASYYGWCADWQNNRIYASVYRASGFEPKFSEFVGNYIDASGSVTTNQIGPVAWWNDLSYELYNPSPTGEYIVSLFGFNSATKQWDTLNTNVPDQYSLSDVNPVDYPKLKLNISLTDTSLGQTDPMELKNINFDYHPLSNAYLNRDDFTFTPDTILQGFPTTMKFSARSYGNLDIDSLENQFSLVDLDSVFYSKTISIPADSVSQDISYIIETNKLLFDNDVRVLGRTNQLEYFKFDNLINKQFFVARDSIRPIFTVTFDGREIINGDIISARPDVEIILEDNSPLPLDTSYFTIVYDDTLLYFSRSDLSYNYTSYPNSRSEINWTPDIKMDGEHTLQILAKDASGNFFDSTSYRITFYVFNESDIVDLFNYPNPFNQGTYFTFSMHGTELPEEVGIKVFTIAGRLIREINVPPNNLIIGFNKIYWNGRDEDGDEIGNGVYLYKLIAKFPDKTKSITQKLARVR